MAMRTRRGLLRTTLTPGTLLSAAWPLGMILANSLAWTEAGGGGAEALLFGALVLPLPLLAWQARSLRIKPMALFEPLQDWHFLFLFASWLVGSALGVAIWEALKFSVLTILSFVIASMYVQAASTRELKRGLVLFGVAASAGLFLTAFLNRTTGRGLANIDLNPNAFGFYAMTAGSFALAASNRLLRYALVAASIFCIMVVDSRASLVGLAAAIGCMWLIGQPLERAVRRVIFGGAAIALVLFLFLAPLLGGLREILSVDDPNRGIGSGFTGRAERWSMAWQAFESHPVFGVGFRCHELVTGENAHNGFLAYLAETGVIGGAAAFLLISAAAGRSWRRAVPEPLDALLLCASVGYLLHSVFERFIFNVGNPGSLLFVLWIVCSMRKVPVRAVRPALGGGLRR